MRLWHNCFRAEILRPAPGELAEKEGKNLTKKIKSYARNELCNGLILCLLLVGCHKKEDKATLKVAASPVPHAEMLAFVQPKLKEQGIDLKILQVEDYNLPNRLLSENEVGANFFQHFPFLREQVQQFGYKITCLAKIHLEPMAVYSQKVRSLEELPIGAVLAVPNDPTNEYRALKIFEDGGLIQLRKGIGLSATVADISMNPKNFTFREIDAAMLPRVLRDVHAAAIPTNFALEVGLNPSKNAIAVEGDDSPYVNLIAVRTGTEEDPHLVALKEAMLSEEMRSFILEKYQGAIIPILESCH
jgi:D-methionine transport system substrate-binding protein